MKEFTLMDDLEGIKNYRKLSDTVATAGQPRERDFPLMAKSGYQVVINLGLADAEYALPDERGLVERLGLKYVHIPVEWKAPTAADLNEFMSAIDACGDKKLFIHCAANKRVSVFMALYRIKRLGWSYDEALRDVNKTWTPDAVWQQFINQMISR